MSEALLWERIRGQIGLFGHFTRIEYNVTAGIPDVSFCIHGVERFIEFKFKQNFPVRKTTAVFKKGGLRAEQIIWHYKRQIAEGKSFILSQVDKTYYLHCGCQARVYNKMTKDEFICSAVFTAPFNLPLNYKQDLINALCD